MAARILANLIIAGGGVIIRAASQAYQQAIVNAKKTGVDNAGAAFRQAQMTAAEAKQILDVEKNATLEEVRKKFKHLFEVNEQHGSFYLQSKVYRAKERLDQEFQEMGIDTSEPEEPAPGQQQSADTSKSA
mmetsp:Transcript_3866/g.11187  ORF Transcript_3866/g.11187 Transcript_3866/m.11187 type:complete len:131 (-) Transcript_3866:824-1216(-)